MAGRAKGRVSRPVATGLDAQKRLGFGQRATAESLAVLDSIIRDLAPSLTREEAEGSPEEDHASTSNRATG
jgi:hypothetical protein